MSIFVSKKKLTKKLTSVVNTFGQGPVLIHTDLLRVGIIEKMKKRDEICFDYEQMIADIFSEREYLFPTFNYDFCRDGLYDITKSIGQVGAFSSYISNMYSCQRTRTPVFNFCIFNNHNFDLKEVCNPFGLDSVFGEIHSLGGTVVFLGADFETNTFIHYIEESLQIGYRYLKPFEGNIVFENNTVPWKIDYRVRPLVEGAAEYDWVRIQSDLIKSDILKKSSLGNSHILWYDTEELFDFFISRMKTDQHYMLTVSSKQIAEKLYKKFGNPLTYDLME